MRSASRHGRLSKRISGNPNVTHSWLTVWGAHFYFWGRIVYAILYMADLSFARSLVWNIPTIGILMNVVGLLLK